MLGASMDVGVIQALPCRNNSMTTRTTDYDATGRSRFYTVAKLGPKRSLTPEGYLLCEAVPVARTGEMFYAEGEIVGGDGEVISGGSDKIIRVSRGPDDLFRAETLASAQGKSVTVAHPDEFVDPDNVKQHEAGVMLNPRRGAGIEDDLMLADLLIKDRSAIDAIQEEEIEEVSLGYEADYEQDQPGRAVQRNILINHVALVEQGRCGPRCAIGDEAMAKKTATKVTDFLMRAFKAKNADEVEKIAEEAEAMDEETEQEPKSDKSDKKTEDALKKVLDKLIAMDADIKELKEKVESKDDDEDDKDDKDGETTDDGDLTESETSGKLDQAGVKLYTGDAAKQIPALAEILAPGAKLPTFDAKTTDAQRAAALCKCQRKALDTAFRTDAGRDVITPFLGGHAPTFDTLPAAIVNAAFLGAASLMKAQNNDTNSRVTVAVRDASKTIDVAAINANNRAFWRKNSSSQH